MTHLPRFRVYAGKRRPTYYYDAGSRAPRRWIKLGHSLSEAMRRYSELEACRDVGEDTITRMIDRWFAWDNKPRTPGQSTLEQYRSRRKWIDRVFGHLRPDELTPGDVGQYLADCKRTTAKMEISVLSQAYDLAVIRREVASNPCLGVRVRVRKSKRGRLLSTGEFLAIREAASPLARVAFDLGYCTLLRPSDIVRLRWDSFGESFKTKKTGARLRFAMTEDIAALLQEAREAQGTVTDMRIIPRAASTLGEWLHDAAIKAGVVDAQFRDIRALAATDAEEAGLDVQKLLGHTTLTMTRVYLRGMTAKTVEPLKRKAK